MDDLRVEQFVGAPPAAVYSHLTEQGLWRAWQGDAVTVDPRPGGRLSVTMPNGMVAEGEFVELIPGTRVVFTWGWVSHSAIPAGSTTVRIELAEEAGGTRVVLTHSGLPDAEVDTHRAGWEHYLPRLAGAAKGVPPAPDSGPGS